MEEPGGINALTRLSLSQASLLTLEAGKGKGPLWLTSDQRAEKDGECMREQMQDTQQTSFPLWPFFL